jgi:hypothetical protein
VVTKSKGIGRGGARVGAGRPRKLGAVEIERDPLGAPPEKVVKRAARKGGKGRAIEAAEEIGLAPDEVEAILWPDRRSPPSQAAEPPDQSDEPENARSMRGLALATLRSIMKNSPQDGARVRAAVETLNRADAEEAARGLGGKKGAQKAAAEAAVSGGGKFAPPAAPGNRTLQ